MDKEGYRKYLLEKKVTEEIIEKFLTRLSDYQTYLEKKKQTLEDMVTNKLTEYTEYLVKTENEATMEFIRSLYNYAYFKRRNDIIEAVIDIIESSTAMDNLYTRIAEWHGEEIRDEIFKGLTIPLVGVHPEKKPEFTKRILKRIEEKLGEEKLIALMKPCLHEGYIMFRDIEKDRKEYQEIGIDAFLEKITQEQIQSFEKNRDEGTPAFAQIVDQEVVDYVRNDPISALGKREGNVIYLTKIPYQVKKLLLTNDERMKRFYACYCPWVRGAIKNGTEKDISKHFCECSAGWYKEFFEKLFEQPVFIEPVETALTGVPYCKIAVHLPDNIIIK